MTAASAVLFGSDHGLSRSRFRILRLEGMELNPLKTIFRSCGVTERFFIESGSSNLPSAAKAGGTKAINPSSTARHPILSDNPTPLYFNGYHPTDRENLIVLARGTSSLDGIYAKSNLNVL